MEAPKPEKVSETLTIYQQKGVFSYGTDAVMLAKYVISSVRALDGKSMCDLCCGTGIIPLMLCDYSKGVVCTGVEINGKACELSRMSAEVSGYSNRFTAVNADIKDYKTLFRPEQFDFLTCNPPYMTADCGMMCGDDSKTIARHEVLCNIDDVFRAAYYLLRTGADIYIVYRTDRLASLFKAAENNRFQIKEMTFALSSEPPSQTKLVVCRAKKGAAEGLSVSAANTLWLCEKELQTPKGGIRHE